MVKLKNAGPATCCTTLPASITKSAGASTPVANGSSGMPAPLALSDTGTLAALWGESGTNTGTSAADDMGDALTGLPGPTPLPLLALPLLGWLSQAAFTAG